MFHSLKQKRNIRDAFIRSDSENNPLSLQSQKETTMIPRETIETILQAARIEEVVGEFVSLKRRGTNLIGLCPFHNEKTPSFNVNPARNIFKCFGCGKAGDSAKFLMEHEHYTYVEAIRYLAKKYNIKIEEKEQTPEEIMAQTVREKMFNINSFADTFFTDTLWKTEEGKTLGLEYFHERGFRDPVIERFHLGFSPAKKDAFTVFAKENGYDNEILEKVGFSINGAGGLYDRFHGRVMFPIHNMTGKVIGFGGRILINDPEKKSPKYQNSPESEIYEKKQTLYGVYFARNAISKENNCILVEGYFDVLRLHQIGIENVVASSGTSLTVEQIRLIKRFTNNITMLYDGDAAGLHAALRGTDMILGEGMNVRVVVLPPEHDPDTFGRDYPIEEVRKYLETNAKDFIRFKTELLLKDAKNDPIRKGEVVRDILQSISVIPDNIFRITYVSECSRLLDMPEQSLMSSLNAILRAKLKKSLGTEGDAIPDIVNIAAPQISDEDQLPSSYYQERELVKLLLLYGKNMISTEILGENGETTEEQISVAQFIVDDLKNDQIVFLNETHQKVFNIFDKAIDANALPDDSFFVSNEDETIALLTADLMSTPYRLDKWGKYDIHVNTEENMLKEAVLASILRYKDLILASRLKDVEDKLRLETDPDNQLILLKEKKNLDDIRVKINGKIGIVVVK